MDEFEPHGAPRDDPERTRRIALVVERDMRRRRRLLLLYALLLLIPIGIGVFYWTSGRTDRAIVHEEVQRDLAPVRNLLEESGPALERVRAAAAQLAAQQGRLEDLATRHEALAAELRPLAEKLPQVERVIAQAEEINRGLAQLRDGLGQQNQRIAELARAQEKIGSEQSRLDGEVRGLSERMSRVPPADVERRLRDNQVLLQTLQNEFGNLKKQMRDRAIQPPD